MNAWRRAVEWALLFTAIMAIHQREPRWLMLAPAATIIFFVVRRVVAGKG